MEGATETGEVLKATEVGISGCVGRMPRELRVGALRCSLPIRVISKGRRITVGKFVTGGSCWRKVQGIRVFLTRTVGKKVGANNSFLKKDSYTYVVDASTAFSLLS